MTLIDEKDVAFFDFYDRTFHPDSPVVRAAAEAKLVRPHLDRAGGAAIRGLHRLAGRPPPPPRVHGLPRRPGDHVRVVRRLDEEDAAHARGEVHIRQRRLVSKAFTVRSVERLRPFMCAKAHELIDAFAGLASASS